MVRFDCYFGIMAVCGWVCNRFGCLLQHIVGNFVDETDFLAQQHLSFIQLWHPTLAHAGKTSLEMIHVLQALVPGLVHGSHLRVGLAVKQLGQSVDQPESNRGCRFHFRLGFQRETQHNWRNGVQNADVSKVSFSD